MRIYNAAKKNEHHTINTNIKNPWKQLNPKFVEGLTSDEIDEVFIAYLFLCADDFLTAYDMTLRFAQYPGLDTLEKVEDKTWECIEKMMNDSLVSCSDMDNTIVTWENIASQKKLVYAIMQQTCELGDPYDFMFDITIKGYMFMKTIYWQHRLTINEIINVAYQN